MNIRFFFGILFVVAGLAAIGIPQVAAPSTTPDGILARGKIDRVVVVVMENRTFDNVFGGVKSASLGATAPYAGADSIVPPPVAGWMRTATFRDTSNTNNFHNVFQCVAGGGFSSAAWQKTSAAPLSCSGWHFGSAVQPFWFLTSEDRRVYWEIAHRYEMGDAFFAPTSTDSYPAHQYIVAGQARDAEHDTVAAETFYGTSGNYPTGCADWAASPDPTPSILVPALGPPASPWAIPTMRGTEGECYDVDTFADLLAKASHGQSAFTWQHYATDATIPAAFSGEQPFNGFVNIRRWWNHPWAPSGKNLIEVARRGAMPNFSWVKPPCTWASDHPGSDDGGPSWVQDVVNAVGSNGPQWNRTVIFVVWDDWGGLYDHVVPPSPRPWDHMGPGLRTPFLVISPYVANGAVTHGVADYGSVMRFVEDLFSLGRLNAMDAHAPDLTGLFDFSQLRPFVPLAA
ncbi:MAG TPA: alkaline phosphatase family protein, partial [Candidatus Elarobacter sp.]